MTKEKESLRPPLFTTFRCRGFPSNAQGRMEALQANHERPANPHERALPSNGVHPYGLPYESGAEALGPSCLRSIARNRESNGKRNCGNVGFAGRRLPALANYFSKQVLKTILLSASFAFGALAPLAAEATSSCAHASFYGVGDGFHGLRAADGSRFNAHGLTTAHRSLPFGTRLLVTNPANNKSVTVTVTDRGPFIAGRSLDLSYGAFSRIASPGQGVARVCFAKL
jgi:rare lipoprotein A